jgi:hypothetical protein
MASSGLGPRPAPVALARSAVSQVGRDLAPPAFRAPRPRGAARHLPGPAERTRSGNPALRVRMRAARQARAPRPGVQVALRRLPQAGSPPTPGSTADSSSRARAHQLQGTTPGGVSGVSPFSRLKWGLSLLSPSAVDGIGDTGAISGPFSGKPRTRLLLVGHSASMEGRLPERLDDSELRSAGGAGRPRLVDRGRPRAQSRVRVGAGAP